MWRNWNNSKLFFSIDEFALTWTVISGEEHDIVYFLQQYISNFNSIHNGWNIVERTFIVKRQPRKKYL